MMRKVGGVRTLWLRRRRESYDWFSGRGPTMRWTINADQKQWWWPWLTMNIEATNDEWFPGKARTRWTSVQHQWPSNICRLYLHNNITTSQIPKYVNNQFNIYHNSGSEWHLKRTQQHSRPSHSQVNHQAWYICTYKEMVKTQNENIWSIPSRHFGSKDPKRDIESGIKVA